MFEDAIRQCHGNRRKHYVEYLANQTNKDKNITRAGPQAQNGGRPRARRVDTTPTNQDEDQNEVYTFTSAANNLATPTLSFDDVVANGVYSSNDEHSRAATLLFSSSSSSSSSTVRVATVQEDNIFKSSVNYWDNDDDDDDNTHPKSSASVIIRRTSGSGGRVDRILSSRRALDLASPICSDFSASVKKRSESEMADDSNKENIGITNNGNKRAGV